MLNVPRKLRALDDPIRVGVIGAGLFGTNLVKQVERVTGMTTAGIADLDRQKAKESFQRAGVEARVLTQVESANAANDCFAKGERAILADGHELIKSDIDVLLESTGIPAVGARHAYEAIMNETHVVMANVEADTVVGPLLAEQAKSNGVTYTMAYGDQPALIAELCDWAETIGLDVIAAGKGNPYLEEYRYGTPDDVFERFGFGESFVESHELNARMYNSFLDGTKVAVEMCAVANATGFRPDVTGMHFPTAEIPEIPEKIRPEADGGLLTDTGVVETVSSLRPDGTSVEHDISFGVFVVTTTPNEETQRYLQENSGSGLYVASDGKYQVFHRPYHLPGVETSVSIANAFLHNEPTGSPIHHASEVVAAAKTDLEPGDEIDGGGGYTVYGMVEDADIAATEDHVPFELLEGATVTEPVSRDTIITTDHVDLDTDSFIYHLRRLQDLR